MKITDEQRAQAHCGDGVCTCCFEMGPVSTESKRLEFEIAGYRAALERIAKQTERGPGHGETTWYDASDEAGLIAREALNGTAPSSPNDPGAGMSSTPGTGAVPPQPSHGPVEAVYSLTGGTRPDPHRQRLEDVLMEIDWMAKQHDGEFAKAIRRRVKKAFSPTQPTGDPDA